MAWFRRPILAGEFADGWGWMYDGHIEPMPGPSLGRIRQVTSLRASPQPTS